MDASVSGRRLSRWQHLGLAIFFAVILLFGGLVELRSAFLSRRMGDLDCYLRAAWAVRVGANPYRIVDDSGWHYNYPPFLAIVLWPLADAPHGADRTGLIPYSVSVAIWYVGSLTCLALGVHWLARALERRGLPGPVWRPAVDRQRWWGLRLTPVLICLVPIGHTLMRGQINLMVILCLCASLAALVQLRPWRAGWWLAWPICIKVYPAFLLLFPLVRRDWRFLGGCAAGLVVGLVLVPLAAFGPARTLDHYTEYVHVTLAPGLGVGSDLSRSGELTWLTSTDSQSLLAAMHNGLHLDPATRPHDASRTLRWLSYLIGAVLTAVTLWASRRQRAPREPDLLLSFGALVVVMLLLCPICHLHYFSMAVPLVMGMLAASWERMRQPRLSAALTALLLVNFVGNILPNLPSLGVLRDCALAGYTALVLWGAGIAWLYQRARPVSSSEAPTAARVSTAA
jgi:hypothetical protein